MTPRIKPGADSQAFFSERHRLVIVSHARCFSKSMNVWFGRMLGYEWPTWDQWYFHANMAKDPKISLRGMAPAQIVDKFQNYRVYFFLRNPYERFYSHLLAHRRYQELTFAEAARNAIFETGIMPGLLLNDVSRKILNLLQPQLVEFHKIPEVLRNIRKELSIEVSFENDYAKQEYVHSELVLWKGARDVPLRELNAPRAGGGKVILPSYKAIYDEDTANLVYSTYEEDFKYFNYSKIFKVRNALLN